MTATPQNAPTLDLSTAPSPHVVRWWLAAFASALVLYAATANRGIQWQDPGHFILRVVQHQPFNPLGLALSHPLHHWLGRLAAAPGLFEPAFAVTLVSAVAGAVAVANVFGCVWTLTRQRWAGLLGAGSLALANTFWQMATRAECYTVSAALLSGECWCLAAFARTRRPGYLGAALLFNGLGFSNHNLALLTIPVLSVLVVRGLVTGQIRARHVALAVGLWVAGALLYLGMFTADWLGSGDFAAAARSALFGKFSRRVLSTAVPANLLLLSAGWVGYNFPNLLLPAAVYGLVRAGRIGVPPTARWALLAGLIIHAGFVVRYNVPDQYMFFVPTYVFLAIFGGVGFAIVLQTGGVRLRRVVPIVAAVLLALTPAVYALAVTAARHYRAMGSAVRNKPYRDDYVYALAPWSVADTSAARLSREAVEWAGPGGLIVVEDEMARYAIEYRAALLPDPPHVVRDRLSGEPMQQALAQGRPIVLVPMLRGSPRTEPPAGAWQAVGDLYLLETAPPPKR